MSTDEYRELHGKFTRLLQEGDRKDIELIEEKALADELALALHISVKYGRPPEQAAEVLARYREARGV